MHQMNKKQKKSSGSALSEANCTIKDLKSEINGDQTQSGVTNDKGTAGSSPDNQRHTSPNEQAQQNAQWLCSFLPAGENPSLVPNPCSPVIEDQWHQSLYPQLGCNPHESLQGQQQLRTMNIPFWIPQHPGYYFPGACFPPFYQPILPAATTDTPCPGPGGGTSSIQHHSSSFYPVIYPCPQCQGLPGPWNPSSSLSHSNSKHLLAPCSNAFQGSCNHFSYYQTTPPHCPTAATSSVQRGIVQLPADLSPKDQELWEAQSSQDVQLRKIVGELQSETADSKCRLKKLETDSESPKPIAKEASNHGTGSSLCGQTSKSVRPRKLANSNGVLLSRDSSWPPVSNQKLRLGKTYSETRQLCYEKVILKKADNVVFTPYKTNGNVETDGSSYNGASIHSAVTHHGASAVVNSEASLQNSAESKTEDTKVGGSNTFVIASQQADRTGTIISSKNYMEPTSNQPMKYEEQEMEDGRSSGTK